MCERVCLGMSRNQIVFIPAKHEKTMNFKIFEFCEKYRWFILICLSHSLNSLTQSFFSYIIASNPCSHTTVRASLFPYSCLPFVCTALLGIQQHIRMERGTKFRICFSVWLNGFRSLCAIIISDFIEKCPQKCNSIDRWWDELFPIYDIQYAYASDIAHTIH